MFCYLERQLVEQMALRTTRGFLLNKADQLEEGLRDRIFTQGCFICRQLEMAWDWNVREGRPKDLYQLGAGRATSAARGDEWGAGGVDRASHLSRTPLCSPSLSDTSISAVSGLCLSACLLLGFDVAVRSTPVSVSFGDTDILHDWEKFKK